MGIGKIWLHKLRSLLFYGGLEKEQCNAIRADIDESNRKSLVILSAACIVVYAVRLCVSFTVVPTANQLVYLIAIWVFLLIVGVNQCLRHHRVVVHISAYLFMALYLGVGILAAVGDESIAHRTTLYLVFLTTAPMMFALNAVELASVITAAELLFLLLITKYQSAYPVYQTNVNNSLFFAVVGVLLGVYMTNMRMKGIYNAYENLRMEEIKRLNEELEKSRADLRTALEAEERANRAKTLFLNNMSHDIRTPMNAIIGFTSLASSHIGEKEQVKNYLEKIMVSSQHLLSLINDVLDMSRIESGRMNIERAPVHLPDIIRDLHTIVQTSAKTRNLEFRIEAEQIENEDVLADKLRLSQILLNILGNAIKFTPPGGAVTLQIIQNSEAPESFADFEFHVKDTGIGMSKEFQKHIFEAFSREDTDTVNEIQGTGLGMSITKNIVELMGGTITVFSEEGKGSEFVVALRFAVCTESKTEEHSWQDAEHSGSAVLAGKEITDAASCLTGKRILLAEDNELNQEIAVELLQDEGFQVDVACNGLEAVEKIKAAKAGHYDLILMDVQMPKMNGYEATRIIRALQDPEKSKIPIIAMTANAFAEDNQAALDSGMDGHIAKPVDVPLLIQTLEQILRRDDNV